MVDDWPTRDFPPMDTPMDLDRIAKAVREILEAIGEDPDRDGLRDTPTRVARLYAEVCSGLHEQADTHLAVTFEAGHDEMVMVRDIAVQSLCEHHLIPFIGRAHVAYIPGPDGRITGLRSYDPVSQIADGDLAELVLLPASEHFVEAGREPAPRFHGSEHWLPEFVPDLATLFDLLPGTPAILDPGAADRAKAFFAQVRGIEAARVRRGVAQGDDFVGLRVVARHVAQPRADAEGAVTHALTHQHDHALQLYRRWCAVLRAHDGAANAVVSNEIRDVHPESRLLRGVENAVERLARVVGEHHAPCV